MINQDASRDHAMPDFRCEQCHELLDVAYNSVDSSPPKPGDLTVCAYCGEAYMIGEDMGMRRLGDEEFKEIDKQCEGQLSKVRMAIVAASVAVARMMQRGC